MTLGSYPDGVPRDQLIPLEPFRSGGDIGRFPNVASRVGLSERGENMAGGCVVHDFNGDGWLDVFYSTIDPSRGCGLFLNRGDGTFRDHSAESQLGSQVGAENCIHADFDNDGDLDVLLLRGAWEFPLRPSLLCNDGTGVFTDRTEAAGLAAPIAAETGGWSDYDGDGDLDLYIGGEFEPRKPVPQNRGKLYRNNGDGTFTDVAESAGVANEGFCRGATWGDYDDDGRPDLYVSNMGQPNRLYHNNGDGTFTDVAASAGVTEPIASYGCWFWDYDNDGKLDIFVTGSRASLSDIIKSHLGMATGGERPRLYHNNGDGTFTDVARTSGLDRVWAPMGCNFGDIDNDGFLDFYLGTGAPPYSFLVPKVLMHNVGGRRFEDVTTSSGTGHLQKGHGIAFADFDRDGDLDLFLECGGATPGDRAHNALFKNPGHHRRWLTLRLVGTRSNRYGVGAPRPAGRPGPGRPAFHLPRHHAGRELRQQPADADDRAGPGRSPRRSRDRLAGRGRSPGHPGRTARRRGRDHRGARRFSKALVASIRLAMTSGASRGSRCRCRQGRRHPRILPRTNPQRGGPRYYFENLGKIFSPKLDDRSVEKMAQNGETAFKDLQSWTILLVGGVREKVRGPGALQEGMHANNHKRGGQGRSRTGDDGPRPGYRAGRRWLRLDSCAPLERSAPNVGQGPGSADAGPGRTFHR